MDAIAAEPGKRALLMDERDDVATVIEPVAAGETVAVSSKAGVAADRLVASEDIPRFHKIALRDVEPGAAVHKYGEVIGAATAPIRRGGYVHVHNVESIKTGVRS